MVDETDTAPPADASILERLPMRNEDGDIRPEFIEEITRCIKADDATFCARWSPSCMKPIWAI